MQDNKILEIPELTQEAMDSRELFDVTRATLDIPTSVLRHAEVLSQFEDSDGLAGILADCLGRGLHEIIKDLESSGAIEVTIGGKNDKSNNTTH